MTDIRSFSQAPKPSTDEVRQLLVHPHVWRSLETWLRAMRVELVPMPPAVDGVPTYGMKLMDGEWGGDAA